MMIAEMPVYGTDDSVEDLVRLQRRECKLRDLVDDREIRVTLSFTVQESGDFLIVLAVKPSVVWTLS